MICLCGHDESDHRATGACLGVDRGDGINALCSCNDFGYFTCGLCGDPWTSEHADQGVEHYPRMLAKEPGAPDSQTGLPARSAEAIALRSLLEAIARSQFSHGAEFVMAQARAHIGWEVREGWAALGLSIAQPSDAIVADTWEAAEIALRDECGDDDVAVSVLQILQARGWRAPNELTVEAEADRLVADIDRATKRIENR